MSSSDSSVSSDSSPQTDVPPPADDDDVPPPVSSFIPKKLPASELPKLILRTETTPTSTTIPSLTITTTTTTTTTPTTTTTTPLERQFTSIVHQHQILDLDSDLIELSQDGKLLAVSQNKCVYIFEKNSKNTDTNTNTNTFKCQPICGYELELGIISLSFSPDSKYLAVVSENVFIFNEFKSEDACCQRIPIIHKMLNPKVTFSHDSKHIAAPTNNNKAVTICIRNTSWPPLFELRPDDIHLNDDTIESMHFSPVSESLAIGTDQGNIDIYNYASGKPLHKIQQEHEDSRVITSVKYSNNGQFLAIGTLDGILSVYNAPTYKQIQKFKLKNAKEIYDLTFSNSGNFIAMGSDKQVLIYDYSSDAIIYEIPVPGSAHSLAYSANDEYLTIAGSNNVLIFDTSICTNEFLQLRYLDYSVYPTYSPKKTYSVKIYGTGGGGDRVYNLQVFKTLYRNESSTIVRLTELPQEYEKIPLPDFQYSYVTSFSRDENYLAFAYSDEEIWIYDLVAKEVLESRITLPNTDTGDDNQGITSIQYSSNGKYLVVTQKDSTRSRLFLYDADNSYNELATREISNHNLISIAFSSDDSRLAVATERSASIFNIEGQGQGQLLQRPLNAPIPYVDLKYAVFSNDLNFLASLEHDNTKLIIYDVMKGSTLFSIDRDDSSSLTDEYYQPQLAFSSDNKVLVIGSKDGLEVNFIQLIYYDDRSMLEWKPYAYPIYFPGRIKEISFANIHQTECSYRICITHSSQGTKVKYQVRNKSIARD